MKKTLPLLFLSFTIFIILLILFVHCNNEIEILDPDPFYPELVVGKDRIKDEHIFIVDRGGTYVASLPLAAILKGLSVPIEWISQDIARCQIGDQDYILSLPDKALYKEDSMTDCIEKGKGLASVLSRRVYEDRKDIYIDNYTMVSTLADLGISVDISWDSEKNEICVTQGVGEGNLSYYSRQQRFN